MTRLLAALLFATTVAGVLSARAHAVPVSFSYSGSQQPDGGPGTAHGFFVIDNAVFDGSDFQFIQNSNIIDLQFSATIDSIAYSFDASDIHELSHTAFNPTLPSVLGASGLLADNGSGIWIVLGSNGFLTVASVGFEGAWAYQGVYQPVASTPLPAALPLFATALGGVWLMGWWRRKRMAFATA